MVRFPSAPQQGWTAVATNAEMVGFLSRIQTTSALIQMRIQFSSTHYWLIVSVCEAGQIWADACIRLVHFDTTLSDNMLVVLDRPAMAIIPVDHFGHALRIEYNHATSKLRLASCQHMSSRQYELAARCETNLLLAKPVYRAIAVLDITARKLSQLFSHLRKSDKRTRWSKLHVGCHMDTKRLYFSMRSSYRDVVCKLVLSAMLAQAAPLPAVQTNQSGQSGPSGQTSQTSQTSQTGQTGQTGQTVQTKPTNLTNPIFDIDMSRVQQCTDQHDKQPAESAMLAAQRSNQLRMICDIVYSDLVIKACADLPPDRLVKLLLTSSGELIVMHSMHRAFVSAVHKICVSRHQTQC